MLTRAHARHKPVALVVPDGTWQQAARMTRKVPWLAALPTVTLPPGPASRYRLRTEPKPQGLATLEAIAWALGLLEGPEVQQELERVLRLMVDRTLFSRGQLARHRVLGGLPKGLRHHLL